MTAEIFCNLSFNIFSLPVCGVTSLMLTKDIFTLHYFETNIFLVAKSQINYRPFALKIKHIFGLLNYYFRLCTFWEAQV
jgi:hypothetical protein